MSRSDDPKKYKSYALPSHHFELLPHALDTMLQTEHKSRKHGVSLTHLLDVGFLGRIAAYHRLLLLCKLTSTYNCSFLTGVAGFVDGQYDDCSYISWI